MAIEIWWDPVCPWCCLGKLDLDAARSDPAGFGAITWRAFQLDPTAGTTPGTPALDLLSTDEPRTEVRARFARITELAARHGVAFDPGSARPVNTFDAHRTALLAQDQGCFDPFADAVMRAHHVDQRTIAAPDVLADLAVDAGLDRAEVVTALADGRYGNRVLADRDHARRSGIGGVPTVVVDGVVQGDLRAWVTAAKSARAKPHPS